jgi:hypothetical protein
VSLLRACCLLFLLAVVASSRVRAQDARASVALPLEAIHAIAADVDEGRNPLYCYHGHRIEGPPLVLAVDSVTVVGSERECDGFGFAFIIRTTDRELLAAALRGVIDQNPGLSIVSAFYRTEDINERGAKLHAPRALSVVRGTVVLVRSAG